jgi:hypothetical protein
MYSLLGELFQLYTQDFDLLYDQYTDPIDIFCLQHNVQEQKELLQEMKILYQEILSGEKSNRDLRNMGLEYIPGDDLSPMAWLPPLIRYLEGKTT